MKRINRLAAVGLAAIVLGFGAHNAVAQRQGGNFDPAQFQQQMMDRYKEQLEVKSEDEWKIISERITKVMEARRDVGTGRGGAFGRQRGGNNGGNGGNGADANAQGGRRNRGGGAGGGGFGGTPSPEAEALQAAIDAKAPADEIKSKLAAFRNSHKEKQAKLEKAQEDLRKVLSVRQEAVSVLIGLLQ